MSDESKSYPVLLVEKPCSQCKEVKPLTEFYKRMLSSDGREPICKDCSKSKYRKYYVGNSGRVKVSAKSRRDEDQEKASRRARKNYERHKPKILIYNRDHSKKRYEVDPVYRLRTILSRQLRAAITGRQIYGNRSRLFSIVGLSALDLLRHLWGTFELRYGIGRGLIYLRDVEIDHIIPKSTAKTIEDVKKLNHYTNLQLLLKEDNAEKRTKLYVKGD